MICKHCGEPIKRSGMVWVADLDLADKAAYIKGNRISLDDYRWASLWCGFDQYSPDAKNHQPSESSKVHQILTQYGI